MRYTSLEQIKTWRRYFHKYPEISLKEFNTSRYIRTQLLEMGIEFEEPMETATIAKIEGKGNKYILLRADIDALPIKEENKIYYASDNIGIMHACGHDAHITMLLATINEVHNMSKNDELNINVIAVFQPSEESFGGANILIDKYDFSKYDIIASYSLHVNPDYNEGDIATKSGNIMANCNEFEVKVKGKSAHVAKKNCGIDSLNAIIQVYQQFANIVVYNIDNNNNCIVHTGTLTSGEVMNSVPEYSKMEGTIRTYNSKDFVIIKEKMESICRGVSVSTDCEIQLEVREGAPAVVNSEELIYSVEKAANKSNANFIMIKEPYLLGEDFSFFSRISPINYTFVGIRNEKLGYTSGLHTPTLMMREEALIYGIDFFVEIVKGYGDL